MLNIKNIQQFTSRLQTDRENVIREYIQHLFLSFLYQQPDSEKLLFKGGTALRIVLKSPRFSEDLDFDGVGLSQVQIENLITETLAEMEQTGIPVNILESKKTTGGYLSIAEFRAYDQIVNMYIEISLRKNKAVKGARTMIYNDYLPPYTLVHAPIEELVKGKMEALGARQKPRDFYDYFFLLSGNYPTAKKTQYLHLALKLLEDSTINFKTELKKFLPAGHQMILKDFKKNLMCEIEKYPIKKEHLGN